MKEQQIVGDSNVLLNSKCVSIFKKLLHGTSNSEVRVFCDEQFVSVEGNDFSYVEKKITMDYYDVNKFFVSVPDYSFIVNRTNILAMMKYTCELLKGYKKIVPVILHSKNGVLYFDLKTNKFSETNEIITTENKLDNDFRIGFNPTYLVNVFSVIDSDFPKCCVSDCISPLFVYGAEYTILLLPMVNCNGVL